MSLKGKTAVVTGGASGIGLATARSYLREGVANVIILDIADNKENIEQLKDEFGHATIVVLLTDITKRDIVEQAFKTILERFHQIDIVINCAGIFCEESIERTINVNLIGLINTSLVALDAMSTSKGGRGGIVVNISSIAGLVALPSAPFYNASKHGVIGFTRTMADKIYYIKHGVKFAAVCPGVTQTPMAERIIKNTARLGEFAELMDGLLATAKFQTAEECGKNIAQITATTTNGGIWIVDGGMTAEVSIPEYWKSEK